MTNCVEIFEEIELDQNKRSTIEKRLSTNDEDYTSQITNYTSRSDQNNEDIKNPEMEKLESKFYHEFMESNKEFFERIGFQDISNDPIFKLEDEVMMKKDAKTNMCDVCKKEISRIFSRNKFCQFCGCILCDKCSQMKRKIPQSQEEKLSTICKVCNNKFKNLKTHEEFKQKLIRKEIEISEYNQKLEKSSLIYSEQLDEINKLNELILKKRRENETKEEMLITETNNLKKRTGEVCDFSEKINLKINENINILKVLEEKKKNQEIEFETVQKDREELTFEFEKKQAHLDELLSKISQLSMSLKNHEQNSKNKIAIENSIFRKETGNKQLDLLLKQKMKAQRKLFTETEHTETTIILNPSKIIKEVYKEPLLGEKEDNLHSNKKDGLFKQFVMFMGSKIFIK